MSCKISTGLTFTCDDILNVGGVDGTFWIGYKTELDTQISITQAADINTLDFGSYGGLRRMEGDKYWHSFGSELQVSANGNKRWKHTFVAKLVANSTADDLALQTLSLGKDIFVVTQDNNNVFYILGAGNGLSVEADSQNTGQGGDSDTTTSITLSGFERTKPLRFALASGYSNTLAYLVSREI